MAARGFCNTLIDWRLEGRLGLTQSNDHIMLAWSARNDISCNRLAIHGDFADSLAYAVRILDSDFVNRATEAASYRVFLPLRTDARIDLKAIVRRLDAEDVLGDFIPVPCCSSREPAVLGLTRTGGVLTGYHL